MSSANLSKAEQAVIKSEIESLMNTLREEMSEELQEQKSVARDFGLNDAHDLGDEAQADAASALHVSQLSHYMQELRACREALKRLASGSYGFCLDCDEAVELNRLKANPVSSRCLSCQSQLENKAGNLHAESA